MGKNVKRLLLFAIKNPGWNTYGKDRATTDAVALLVRDGFIVVNETRQFRLDLPDSIWKEKRDIADMLGSRQTQFTRCQKCGRLHDSGWECVHCRQVKPVVTTVIRPRIATGGQREFGGAG